MELARGMPIITECCDRNSRSTRLRLDLFIQVRQVLQHAQQEVWAAGEDGGRPSVDKGKRGSEAEKAER